MGSGRPSERLQRPFCFQGRFTIAAKHHISIAEIYETELVDIEKVNARESGECRRAGARLSGHGEAWLPVLRLP